MLGLRPYISSSKLLAFAIVGQALLDEGSILTDKIELFYNDRNTAFFVYSIAKRSGLAKRFRKKLALQQLKFGFTIPREAWKPFYRAIGPLPDKRKDIAFRFLLRRRSLGALRPRGESKRLTLRLLHKKPRTIRELCYALGLSGSTVRRHLKDLATRGKVKPLGRDKHSKSGKSRSAVVWFIQ